MQLEGCQYTAVATDGDVQLGGIDWDRRIVDFVAEHFLEQHGTDPRQDPVSFQMLLQEAEDAKRALSNRTSVTVRFAYQSKRVQVALTREEFEALTSDLLQRTMFTVERLLRTARLRFDDVTRLLLVGGSTRMPMVQQILEQTSGRSVDRSLSPDEAVAHGAALYAGFLQQGSQAADRSLVVKNVNSHDLGVLGIEKATGMKRRSIMIPRNTKLPARSKSSFVTHRANQRSVAVHVVEGGDDSGKNATPIGKCLVSDLPAKLPAKTPVVVQFYYAANGRLSVKASLPDMGIESSVTRRAGFRDDANRRFSSGSSGIAVGSIAAGTRRRALAAGSPPFVLASPTATPAIPGENADFEGPHVFEEEEPDSEVFSDLEF